MGKTIKIKIEEDDVNDLDRLLLLGAAFMWEVEKKEGFLPIEKERLQQVLEKVRRQLEPYCKKEKMSVHNHKRYIMHELDRAGFSMTELEENDKLANGDEV